MHGPFPPYLSLIIDHTNVAYCLAERRLLDFRSVVDGDFMIVDQNSRNRNLKIIRKKHDSFFIKQPGQQTPDYAQSMKREAACYQLANENPQFRSVQSVIPRFHFFDPANNILVIELLADCETLWQHHQRVGCFPVEIARLQGETLGAFHRSAHLSPRFDGSDLFTRQIPWILSIHETNPMYLNQVSRGNAQLISIVQQYPEFQTSLGQIKAGWTPSTLIHGDIKWENMLFRTLDGKPELKIIDWEIADIGDECWDAGAVIQAYLTFWIFSLPLNSGMALADAAGSSPYEEEGMREALAAYWSSYSDARGLDLSTVRAALLKSMSCAGARMIQTAYESIQSSPEISPFALCKLQMSMNILRDPQAAVRELMGL